MNNSGQQWRCCLCQSRTDNCPENSLGPDISSSLQRVTINWKVKRPKSEADDSGSLLVLYGPERSCFVPRSTIIVVVWLEITRISLAEKPAPTGLTTLFYQIGCSCFKKKVWISSGIIGLSGRPWVNQDAPEVNHQDRPVLGLDNAHFESKITAYGLRASAKEKKEKT